MPGSSSCWSSDRDAYGRVCQADEQALKILGFTGFEKKILWGIFRLVEHEGKLIKASHGPMARSLRVVNLPIMNSIRLSVPMELQNPYSVELHH